MNTAVSGTTSPGKLGPEADRAEVCAAIGSAVVPACVNAFGSRLRAIVLTGSTARGESTFIWNVDHWDVLGDAEFFIVFEQRSRLPGPARTESIRQRVESSLIESGLHCHLDLSPVHPKYLANLERHILAYELKECGRVVWGDPEILSLIPRFESSEILLEDAWRLLSNRIVEYLEVVPDLMDSPERLSPAVFYRTVKLYLDMATSFLVFARRYEPTYRGRAARLRELAATHVASIHAPLPLREFADRVIFCTEFKLQQYGNRQVDGSCWHGDEAMVFWRKAVEYAHQLWRWELCQMTGSAERLSDGELIRLLMHAQPLRLKVRGWLSTSRRCGWARNWRSWRRWVRLGSCASPRYWIYAAAAKLCFGLPEANAEEQHDWKELQSWLPLIHATDMRSLCWRELLSDVVMNYHRFVETTSA